ncbi:MAG: hypothetical protein M0037_14695 [Betaproteobacteria bacterium]|nr:hypothetical protein [Betaproteobacteria bacterium]
MATKILLQHPVTGLVKTGFYGFSWTTLFFGGWPALFRGDFLMAFVFIVLEYVTFGLSGLVLAFTYNKIFTTKLIEGGYVLAGSAGENALAAAKLGIALPS